MTDADYLSLVNRASSGGKHFFTLNQLYYFYCAERMPARGYWPLAGIIGGAIGYYALGPKGAAMAAVTSAVMLHFASKSWKPPPRSVLDDLHEQMAEAGNPINRFIEKPLFEFRDESKYTDHLPNACDIEHVIVVDRNSLVDLLVLNDLPKRTNSLVISDSGYPNYVVPIVQELLAKRKNLSIYLLHDSTESRLGMKRNLSDSEIIQAEGHRMFNLGIEPDQVRYMKRLAPIQPARTSYRIPVDSIPYPILEASIGYSIMNRAPLLTAFAFAGFVGKD